MERKIKLMRMMNRKIVFILSVLLLLTIVSVKIPEEGKAEPITYELVENGRFDGSDDPWILSESSSGSPDANGNRHDSTHTNTSDGSGCIETYVQPVVGGKASQTGNWTQSLNDISNGVIVNGAYNCWMNDIAGYGADNITATANVSVHDTTGGWKQVYSNSTYWDDLGDGSTGWNNFKALNKNYTPVGSVDQVSVELYVEVKTSDSQQANCSLRADDISVRTEDTTKPEIVDTTDGTPKTGGSFNVTANVTDNIEVDTVWLDYTLKSAEGYNKSYNRSMNRSSDYWRNISIWNNATELQYTIEANDTSNHWNSSTTYSLEVEDIISPEMDKVSASPSTQNVGGYINITAEVTDNHQIDEVWVNISHPDESSQNVSIDPTTGDVWYLNSSYNELGNYEYFIWANDTSGNSMRSSTHFFEIEDTIAPDISSVSASPNVQESGRAVNITADVIDNHQVDEVWLNISYPDESSQNVSMDPTTGDAWYLNSSYTELGQYDYFIWANDTAGNVEMTAPDANSFDIQDTTSPAISNVSAFPSTQETDRPVNITAEVTDNHQVDEVWVNISHPDSTYQNESMDMVTGHIWYFNSSYTDEGDYEYFIWANDTSNTWNVSGDLSFVIQSPLTANDDYYNTDEDTPVSCAVLANDTDPEGSLDPTSVKVTKGPLHGSVTVNTTTGEIKYTPDTNYSGSDTFNYTVDDNHGATSNPATVHITVNERNDAPRAKDDSDTCREGAQVWTNVTLNDVDDNDDLDYSSLTIADDPSNGSIIKINHTTGEILYEPNPRYVGTDSYTYKIVDGGGKSDIATVTITIYGISPPNITNIQAQPSSQKLGKWVNITCDVTDDYQLYDVWVNVTYPDGSWTNTTMEPSSSDTWYYNETYIDLGTHSFTIRANDTLNHWNSSGERSFEIEDTTAPEISEVMAFPGPQEIGGHVNISADITDNYRVDEVWVNISEPDGDHQNISMTKGQDGGWYYNSTYDDLGTYNYTIRVKDTSNNWNSSSGHSFEIVDSTKPEIDNVSASPDIQETRGYINITAEITDNDQVVGVWVDITHPNGTSQNVSMNPGSGDLWYYNSTYAYLGDYTYTIRANDDENNWNSSSGHSFEIKDSTKPEIDNVSASPDIQETGGYVNITAEITDNDQVNEVWLNITLPDGDYQNVSMERYLGEEWFYDSTYHDIGNYDYTIWARDMSDDWNSSSDHSFVIQDTTAPVISNVVSSPDPQETGKFVNITAEVTDNYEVSQVWVKITGPDSDYQNVTMDPCQGKEWFYNSTYHDVGNYEYIIWARDTSGNWNSVGDNSFLIRDKTIPDISDIAIIPNSQSPEGHVNVTAEITDDDQITGVWINITYPDGSYQNISMDRGRGEKWYYNSTYADTGSYSYTIWAKDTSDNWNGSNGQSFEIDSSEGPSQTLFDGYWWIILVALAGMVGAAAFLLTNSADKDEAVIDEIFLIGNDAMLIAHETRRIRPDMDEDVMAGMLTAIQNFIKDSFKDEDDWRINKLEFEDNKILIERGDHVYIAVKYSGQLSDEDVKSIRDTIDDIEEEYKDVLEDWDGNMDKLRGARDILKQVFQKD